MTADRMRWQYRQVPSLDVIVMLACPPHLSLCVIICSDHPTPEGLVGPALTITSLQLLLCVCPQVAFEESSTSLSLFPYKVIPLRVGKEKAPGGIIECVPNVKSRDEVSAWAPLPCYSPVRSHVRYGCLRLESWGSPPCLTTSSTRLGGQRVVLSKVRDSCAHVAVSQVYALHVYDVTDARRSMIRSLAAYAVVCYLLQVREMLCV